MKRILKGKWRFRRVGDESWSKATVPGCNYTDLLKNGCIFDPIIYDNEKKVQWVNTSDWEYMHKFTITREERSSKDILLCCDMLDTICDVYINNNLIFSSDNCFVAHKVSVKKNLYVGNNTLKIYFHSPVKYVEEKYKQCPTPPNANGQDGIVHIRKPQCHFGWDWGPVLPPSGIPKPIYLDFVKEGRIKDFTVTQKITTYAKGIKAIINTNLVTEGDGKFDTRISLVYPNGNKLISPRRRAEFTIEDPELWWTYELSGKEKQPLYTMIAEIIVDGEVVDSVQKRIGIRTIELDRGEDEWGHNFCFRLNGVPLFIKGANYIPPDCFISRYFSNKVEKILDAVQYSNMNMIRIWGGGYYESDEFYDACDERGILVWQDFPFACQAYPFFDEDFLNNVKKEVRYNVKRLMSHPSLAVWCGNNEIEDMHLSWINMKEYIEWTEKFFYDILPDIIRKYDRDTPYTPGSPVGASHNVGMGADNVGDTHLWAVWHGLKPMNYYRKRLTRFCSEFGFESMPDMNMVKRFARPEDMSFDSDVFKSHQKCDKGNEKMVYYIASRFNLPKHFRDYIYLSQITQLECVADATEHWRRNKGRCNGSMYWQLNDCWGCVSWSSLDYCCNYKALQYGARYFNAPVSISIEDTSEYVKLFALNDLNEKQRLVAEYEFFDFNTGTLETDRIDIVLPELRCKEICSFSMKSLKQKFNLHKTGFAVRLYRDDELLMQKVLLFDKEKNLSLPKAHLSTKIELDEDKLNITVSTDKFARLVNLETSESANPFSDDFFDLLPGQSKTVTIKKDRKLTLRELAESIRVYSLCNIEFDNNIIRNNMKKLNVYLSPTNVVTAAYHSKPAFNVNLSKKENVNGNQ